MEEKNQVSLEQKNSQGLQINSSDEGMDVPNIILVVNQQELQAEEKAAVRYLSSIANLTVALAVSDEFYLVPLKNRNEKLPIKSLVKQFSQLWIVSEEALSSPLTGLSFKVILDSYLRRGGRVILMHHASTLISELVPGETHIGDYTRQYRWTVSGHHSTRITKPDHILWKDIAVNEANVFRSLGSNADGKIVGYPRYLNASDIKKGVILGCHGPSDARFTSDEHANAYIMFVEWNVSPGKILFCGSQFFYFLYGTQDFFKVIHNVVFEW